MNIHDILTIYEYNYWSTRQILAGGTHIGQEQFRLPTAQSFGSLRGTLVHILDTERAWRMLCQHDSLAYFNTMKEEEFPPLGRLEIQ